MLAGGGLFAATLDPATGATSSATLLAGSLFSLAIPGASRTWLGDELAVYNPNPADQRGIWVFGASLARVYPVELGDSSAVRLTAIDGGLLAAAFFKSPSDGDTSSAGTIQVGTTRQEIAPGPDYLVTFRP